MTAEDILNEFIKGDIARDYSPDARKRNTITLDTAIKCIEAAIKQSYDMAVEDCKTELLKQMFLMVHRNGYPSEAVPKATILSLHQLVKPTQP